jgi:hypothetical protein
MVGGVSLTRSTGDSLSLDSANAGKTFVDAYITLVLQHTPDPVGSVENVTASVVANDGSGAGYKPVAGAVVNLSILSGSVGNFVPSGTTATCTTDATGACTVQITSNIKGTTTVHATTTITVSTVSLTRSTGDGISQDSSDVVKTWNPITPTMVTAQSAGGTVGSTSLTDTANITGAFGAAGPSDLVSFSLYGPFTSAASVSCSGTAVFSEAGDQFKGGTAGTANQSWTVSTSGFFKPTLAGYYAWQATANFSGDQSNTTPNATPCSSEVVQIQPVKPTLITAATAPASTLVNTTVSISDTGTLSGFVLLQPGDSMTFNLYGPFSGGTPVCDTTGFTNRVLGPFTGTVDTTSGSASSGSVSFTPTAAGTYYWVASFSGDINNTPLNATNIGCGDSHEAVVVVAPSAQITPTGTTCQQFVGGTSSTLSNFTYSGTGTIGTDQPGVFFYYDRFALPTGAFKITITESINTASPFANLFPSGESNYLLHILNDNTSQVILYDNNCNVIGNVMVTFMVDPVTNTYTVTLTGTITGTPAPFYVLSAKYTPKTLVGLQIPTPTTLDYVFTTSVNGVLVVASQQDIKGIKQ